MKIGQMVTYELIIPEEEEGLPDNDPTDLNRMRQSIPISAVTPGP